MRFHFDIECQKRRETVSLYCQMTLSSPYQYRYMPGVCVCCLLLINFGDGIHGCVQSLTVC